MVILLYMAGHSHTIELTSRRHDSSARCGGIDSTVFRTNSVMTPIGLNLRAGIWRSDTRSQVPCTCVHVCMCACVHVCMCVYMYHQVASLSSNVCMCVYMYQQDASLSGFPARASIPADAAGYLRWGPIFNMVYVIPLNIQTIFIIILAENSF